MRSHTVLMLLLGRPLTTAQGAQGPQQEGTLPLVPLVPPAAAKRLNAQAVSCLPAGHPLAPNQAWSPVARLPLDLAAAGPSCPLTQSYCFSGYDLLPTGRANQSMGSCCDLCHATRRCVGVVLTTRTGNPGLTCYLKSTMGRPGGGKCESGTMGQPFPPHSGPPPPPPPAPPAPPAPPLPPSLAQPVQLRHRASGLCLESRTGVQNLGAENGF